MIKKIALIVLINSLILTMPQKISDASIDTMETRTVNVTIIKPEPTFELREIPIVAEPQTQEPQLVLLGEFKITAYCSCEICCEDYAKNRPLDDNGNEIVYGSIGEVLTPEYSVAVDPSVIPYETVLYFNGNEYIAHDCGGAIKQNRIDVYFDSHQDALEWGVQYHEVFILESEETI